jgi:PAS domain S-box-containing protein
MQEKSIRLLLVEDDEDDYILTEELLQQADGVHFDLTWANSYAQGITQLKRDGFDAALIDYRLGEKTGLDLIREAVQAGVQIPLILLTGQGSYSVDMEAMHAGATDYLVKEEATSVLLERSVRYAIERKGAELALRRAQEELEWRVEERTQELAHAYRELMGEMNERKRAEHRLIALAEFSHALAEAGTNDQQVFQYVAQRVSELIGEGSVLMLLNEEGTHLNLAAAYHPDPRVERQVQQHQPPEQYELGRGYAGRVAESGEPLRLELPDSPEQDEQLRLEYPYVLEGTSIHALLSVPLRVQGEIVGILGVTRSQKGWPYSAEDQAFLQQLADRAALAIVNAHLFRALQSELSERARAEEALRESESRFRTIFNESVVGIGLIALDGRLLAANQSLQSMLGYSELEIRGLTMEELTHPEDRYHFSQIFPELIAGKRSSFHLEKRYLHKSGRVVWGRMGISMVRDMESRPQFGIAMVEDITSQKKVEAELAEVQHRLTESRDAERLHLARELHDGPVQDLYAVTYQLKSLQDLLLEEWEQSESPERAQAKLAAVQGMLTHIIQGLRATSREMRPPTLAAFGLQKTIQSYAESFQHKYPELDIELQLTADGQVLPENMRLALFRIFQQSLINIQRHAQAKVVMVKFDMDEDEIRLSVSDDGKGFTVPATWVDLVREGHLGLAGASERAETFGGRLEVFSEPGKGTRLIVRIPLQQNK